MLYLLSNVVKRFGSRKALDIDHLALPENEGCALLGANGSGKTTLLHVLALLTPPTSGTIRFMEETVDWRESRLRRMRREVVLVDQHPIMFSMPVLKNVGYGPKMRGIPRSGQKRIAMECLERVGMLAFAHRPAHLLSGGETRRVAIARALACDPKVLLLDEPMAGVDLENQAVIENIIHDICRERRMTVIFSTHNPLQAERLVTRKLFLDEGRPAARPVENRFPLNIIRDYRLLEAFTESAGRMTPDEDSSGWRDRAHVIIDPEKIRISPGETPNGHAENVISARILQMNAENGRIRIVFDTIGHKIQMAALMPATGVRDAGILVGDQVSIVFEPGAVRLEV